MKLLYYNGLDTSKVKKQFQKVEQAIASGDFRTADVKKMQQTGYYRAKLDRENRLLFKFVTYKGETYILLLEVIHHHTYDKSKFLRGAEVDERKFQSITKVEQVDKAHQQNLRYLNSKRNSLHVLDKFISFDDEQHEIYGLPTPLVIIGSAGSGKTALTLEKMKYLRGHIAYISLSPYLVENSQKTYYTFNDETAHQEVDFLSFREYLESIHLPTGKEIDFKIFAGWYARYRQAAKIKDDYKLYEEFKGVLTGSPVHAPYLSRKEYLALGVKQSIFLKADRERVYDVFEKYLAFLSEKKYYDSNIIAWNYLQKIETQYDFIVVDEVQDFTNVQLSLILKSLTNPTHFFLSGDSNQIVHPNFFSWSKLKSLFFSQALKGSLLRVLKTNYRNSQKITDISNRLLKIKHARFGSIDKESTYLIDTVSHINGEINLLADSEKIKKELNQKTERSTHFAILVMNQEDKARVRQFFKTPLIFSIQEAKGLEYENIILINFISQNDKEFREITRGVSSKDLETDELRYARAKDKENKELEAYKFYINSLYVAFTRAVKNLYLIEIKQKHELLKLLDLVEPVQQLKLQAQSSNEQEWLAEARRLEMQGKLEQAEEIRARLRGISYLNAEQLATLKEEVFRSLNPSLEARQQLFNYAQEHFQLGLIQQMKQKVNYGPAKHYLQEYGKAQQTFGKLCLNGNKGGIERIVKKFGINFQTPNQETGLMLSVLYNKPKLREYFLAQEAKQKLTDHKNRTVMHMALLGYELEYLDLRRMSGLYLQFQLPFIKCKVKDRIIKISPKYMEYFLVVYLQAVRDAIIELTDPKSMQGLKMDEFMEFIEEMPESILPAYRRKRQYVNSVLANNEINRDYQYNRFLFERKSRGCYNLNPNMEVLYE